MYYYQIIKLSNALQVSLGFRSKAGWINLILHSAPVLITHLNTGLDKGRCNRRLPRWFLQIRFSRAHSGWAPELSGTRQRHGVVCPQRGKGSWEMHFVYFVCLVKIFTYCLLTFESKARHPRIPNQDFPRIPNRHSRPSCLNCSVKEILRSNIHTLLLGSMYFCSWLIQLNRSYKYHGKITRTGISTSNDHISKSVALREKLKKINCHYFGSR